MVKRARNRTRFDPYKNFRFKVSWDGRYVAGISKVTALRRFTEIVQFREGANPASVRKGPGRTDFEAITLERGLTQDQAFEQWANSTMQAGSNSPPANFRKDVILDIFNARGQKVLSYKIFRCWVSEYQALPDLDSTANAVIIEHIKLENEGWERDLEVG